ncbi:venom carboxylesterase-6-like [Copidosoma floridanum]|uniref:venom carboxylesterase-6-like n=1 Tax=Copidosoma floridanum TaxID=29053 RepID=UPI0006C9694A|nr:venom carboxylesterase-6-like [Copidosoma floridanum]
MKPSAIHVLFISITCWTIQIFCFRVNVPQVITSLGKIKGYLKVSHEQRYYEAFEGIPYALPPTNELRFQPPLPVEPWEAELDATSKKSDCIQYDHKNDVLTGVEDCLYLNIYRPVLKTTSLLPVLLWIHGGGFQYGTSTVVTKYIMDRDLILVSISYRLGPFGFLSTGDDLIPGNMGLKDQNLALRWTSEHIHRFGGDPKRISLLGVSAGASSVHYHYLSPSSAGLFRNGVSFSGTALSSWAYSKNPREGLDKLTRIVCKESGDSIVDVIDCLKRMPADQLNNAAKDLLVSKFLEGFQGKKFGGSLEIVSYLTDKKAEYLSIGVITPSFKPVAERIESDYFINRSPEEILNDKVYDVPWITGVTSEEGIFFTAGFVLNDTSMSFVDKNWDTVGPYLMQFEDKISADEFTHAASVSRRRYLGDRVMKIENDTTWLLTYLVGDKVVTFDSQKAARLQAKVNRSPVRFFYYNYRAIHSLSDELTNTTINFGVCHADDVYLLLEDNNIIIEVDGPMLNKMMDFWYSVAATGEPDLGVKWLRVHPTTRELHYLHFMGPESFIPRQSDDLGQKKFWESIGF